MNTDTTSTYVPGKLPISAWAEEDRPRDKVLIKGKSVLSDAELLSILIGSGTREENALDLAKRILSESNHNLNAFGKLSVSDLTRYKGIGKSKAVMIVAAIELGRRRKFEDVPKREVILTSADAVNIFQPMLGDLTVEQFWILYLTRTNSIIGKQMISSGGMSGTVVDPKVVFKNVIEAKAVGVILCHNHPSGNTKPSQQDIDLTKKLVNGGKLLEVSILDHVIVAANSFYSFADAGMM